MAGDDQVCKKCGNLDEPKSKLSSALMSAADAASQNQGQDINPHLQRYIENVVQPECQVPDSDDENRRYHAQRVQKIIKDFTEKKSDIVIDKFQLGNTQDLDNTTYYYPLFSTQELTVLTELYYFITVATTDTYDATADTDTYDATAESTRLLAYLWTAAQILTQVGQQRFDSETNEIAFLASALRFAIGAMTGIGNLSTEQQAVSSFLNILMSALENHAIENIESNEAIVASQARNNRIVSIDTDLDSGALLPTADSPHISYEFKNNNEVVERAFINRVEINGRVSYVIHLMYAKMTIVIPEARQVRDFKELLDALRMLHNPIHQKLGHHFMGTQLQEAHVGALRDSRNIGLINVLEMGFGVTAFAYSIYSCFASSETPIRNIVTSSGLWIAFLALARYNHQYHKN